MTAASLQQLLEEGVRLHSAGQFEDAEAAYQLVLKQSPGNPDALHLLGLIALQFRRYPIALDLIGRAITMKPGIADFHVNLGVALSALGKHNEAIQAHSRALNLQPEHSLALRHLADALLLANRWDESIACYGKLLKATPDDPDVFFEIGRAFYRKGELREAEKFYRTSIALNPMVAAAHSNLGNTIYSFGEYERAAKCWERAIALEPNYARAHLHLGVALLTLGDWERGWAEYEWRRKIPGMVLGRAFPTPVWDGSDLAGKQILLFAEQGFGDAIFFLRYLPRVAQRAGRIVLAPQRELVRLFKRSPLVDQCVQIDGEPPPHDVHCSLVSLPFLLKERTNQFPLDTPFLSADPSEIEYWTGRMPTDRFKVGLVWAGSSERLNDCNRSMTLNDLLPITSLPGLWLASLQIGPAKAQLDRLPPGTEIVDWTDELKDFADTAALIANLDLIITVDTAVANLAGALGKRVWILLGFVADWRYLLNRGDSPWYPTARLFRQPAVGDWKTVLDQVIQALRNEVSSK
jgi:tetratricopeptide (TPR) repeat protein